MRKPPKLTGMGVAGSEIPISGIQVSGSIPVNHDCRGPTKTPSLSCVIVARPTRKLPLSARVSMSCVCMFVFTPLGSSVKRGNGVSGTFTRFRDHDGGHVKGLRYPLQLNGHFGDSLQVFQIRRFRVWHLLGN